MTKIILCLVSCLVLLTACASAKNVVPQGKNATPAAQVANHGAG
jgi:hypothetical protein